jgi:hypothetical protein
LTPADATGDEREALADDLRAQAVNCRAFGSPLYAALLERSAEDAKGGGPVWETLHGLFPAPGLTFVGLHLMGAVHRLVLEGRAPDVASYFPSAGGDGDPEAAWLAMRALLGERPAEVRRLAGQPIQTNEPGRAAALLGGFLLVALRTSLPLRLMEVGTSAGLNLRWDRFRYESGGGVWGDPASPVRIAGAFEDRVPPLDVSPQIVERAGCDANPVDPMSEDGRLTLMSYVWADQLTRLDALRGAIDVAREVPAHVARSGALDWLPERLRDPVNGAATVVFHSMFLPYLASEDRARLDETIRSAGELATSGAPLAVLSLEGTTGRLPAIFEVRLRMWPPGTDELIAIAQAHGPPVRWLGWAVRSCE